MDYSIRFIGHVIETRKPTKDWPDKIEYQVVFRADEEKAVRDFLTLKGNEIKLYQGIFTQIDLPGRKRATRNLATESSFQCTCSRTYPFQFAD